MGLERFHAEEEQSKTLFAPDLWNIVASKSGTVDKVQKNSLKSDSLDVYTWIPVLTATALSVSLRVGHGPLHTPLTMTLEHSPTFPTRELNSGTHTKLK